MNTHENFGGVVIGPTIDRTTSRPILAILDAKPGREQELRDIVIELTRNNRMEPGCITFIPYESDRLPQRFYLYEVFADADAFETHLRYDHVKHFRSLLPTVSTSGPADVVQLIEIPISDPVTQEHSTMWSTDYSIATDLPPDAVWNALRDWTTGVVPQASGDRHQLRGAFAAGGTITSNLAGQDTILQTAILAMVDNTLLATETPFNGLNLLTYYSLQQSADGGTHVTHTLTITGEGADDQGPKIGSHISSDFPETMNEVLTIARSGTATTP